MGRTVIIRLGLVIIGMATIALAAWQISHRPTAKQLPYGAQQSTSQPSAQPVQN